MIKELLDQIKNGRTKEDFVAVKDALLIITSNMYYDDKLTNSEYNEICGLLMSMNEIVAKAN